MTGSGDLALSLAAQRGPTTTVVAAWVHCALLPPGKERMTVLAGMMLVRQIVPLIQAAIRRGAVKATGCEDPEELAAEGVAMAARSLDAAEQKGKVVAPSSLAYYAVQALKSGRRSGYAGRTDAMSASAQLDRRVALSSMDEGLMDDEDGLPVTLHDCLAAQGESADVVAARRLDWCLVAERLSARESYIVHATAAEVPGKEMAKRLKVCGPRVVQIKRSIAGKIQDAWGQDALKDAVRDTRWQRHVRSVAERCTCRAEHRAA